MITYQTVEDRSACAIIAFVDKRGRSSHAAIVQTIDALRKMGHRSGDINGEGDGCGICTDIPVITSYSIHYTKLYEHTKYYQKRIRFQQQV